jgi:hypothetical protein
MRDLIFLLGYLLILVLPIIAIIWVIYRLAKGSGGKGPSITGD